MGEGPGWQSTTYTLPSPHLQVLPGAVACMCRVSSMYAPSQPVLLFQSTIGASNDEAGGTNALFIILTLTFSSPSPSLFYSKDSRCGQEASGPHASSRTENPSQSHVGGRSFGQAFLAISRDEEDWRRSRCASSSFTPLCPHQFILPSLGPGVCLASHW